MNIERLNINVNGVVASGFKGSNNAFNNVELLVGGKLPLSYVDFIRQVDGGHPEVGCFYPDGGNPQNLFAVDWFYSFGNSNIEDIYDAIDNWSGLLGNKALPIARDAGGNQIYLDLDKQIPAVWIYLHDESDFRIKVANSFDEFLAMLIVNPDFI